MQRPKYLATLILFVLSLSLAALAQQGLPDSPQPQASPQALPDSPGSKVAPAAQLPTAPINPSAQTQPMTGDASSADTAAQSEADSEKEEQPKVAPQAHVSPSNRKAQAPSSGFDEVSGTLKVSVNAVPVSVTVKDATGHLFPGLTKENFAVYEDGVKQRISFFTSDPFPVSAAIIVDVGMPEITLRKIKETFSAMMGAFSRFDEVSIYTYGNTVRQQQDYVAALGPTTEQTLTRVQQQYQGPTSGPSAYNPMTVGPTVNGRTFDPGTQRNQVEYAPPKDAEPSHVLNDAVAQAAIDLGRREKARRRVIFVLSDGHEYGSRASYKDVLRVLLTNNIAVYGVETDTQAIKYYNKLSKIHLPHQGYNNVLPKYSAATGGQIFNEFTQQALESAYGAAMEEARSQYTMVYYTEETKSTTYRKIEVRVGGYGPSLKVYARDGYYPAPQQ